ncbi:MAG: hypothetical protein CMM61_02550 [Rhodospirillaceae bacterium]|nr:hypothetical protein [Rhodospirillaceae bacterium]
MARGLPRFEASDDLFKRALAAGAINADGDAVAGAEIDGVEEGTSPADTATAGEQPATAWRALRLERIEAMDQAAVLPPPLMPLPPEAAVDIAEPEPEEVPPTPRELEEALSEAVDRPDDWMTAAELAGGTPVAHCLRELLDALNWNGAARQIAEALPELGAALTGEGAAEVMGRLGFRCRRVKARLNELGPQDFPALFVTPQGDALVLKSFDQNGLPGFDGASRTRRPIARDGRAGTAYVFTAVDPDAAQTQGAGADLPDRPLALIWSRLKARPVALALTSLISGGLALAGPMLLLIALDHAVPSGSLPMILFFAGAAALALLVEAPLRALRDSMVGRPVAGLPDALGLWALTRTLFLPPGAQRRASAGARRVRYDDFRAGGAGPVARLALAYADLPAALVALAGIAVLNLSLVGLPILGVFALVIAGAVMGGLARPAQARAVRALGGFLQRRRDFARVADATRNAGSDETFANSLEQSEAAADAAARAAAGRGRLAGILGRWIAGVTVAATAAAGAYQVADGGMSAGSLAAALLLTWAAMGAGSRLLARSGEAARIWCGLAQLGKLQAMQPERGLAAPSAAPRRLAGHVDVSGLSTAPLSGVEMPLDDVSLYADPGEVVAVVGDYQSGKSALLQVLAGLQPASAGHARLDGIEAAQFDPLQLRQSVAYVPETPEFLPLSIEDNLRLMNPVASDVDIQDACTLAGVMEDIRVMETGIGANRRFGLAVDMTPFTRDPHPGFLKRLALARGYLRQSGLLLLDGPERHLDPAGEQALLAAIEQLRGETTVIVATDRPQIIRLADRVLWLDGGRTRGAGPSAQVLQQLYDEGRVGQTLTEQ